MATPSQYPYYRSPNLSTRSYDSSSVSSATSPQPQSQYLSGILSNNPRHNVGPPPQPIGMASLPPVNQNFHQYSTASGAHMMGRESLGSTDSQISPSVPNMPRPGLPSQQKRAYRQRRKDPSCDACRERKVKCDATETTSCSECSSRNVKCQFTKETNRRMSSIKQVQDLERQMDRVKRENSGLRRMLQDRDGQMEVDLESVDHQTLPLPEVATEPRRRKRPASVSDLGKARANVRNFSRGIWKPPAQFRAPTVAHFDPPRPELPSRHLVDHLLQFYYSSSHTMFPVLHFPTFQSEVDTLYSPGGSARASTAWLSLFFAVLATGSLFSPVSQSSPSQLPAELIEKSQKLIDPWTNEFTLDHVRSLTLVVLCLNEMNLKSAAWSWLGRAVRIGQDLGLYTELGSWPMIEGEVRRRTWWTLYIFDRALAAELGRPYLIRDEDCDVSLPAPVDDQYIVEGGIQVSEGVEPLTHSVTAVIHVVRSYTALIKALESPAIPPPQLATFESHFKKSLGAFPTFCDPATNAPLAPHYLPPLTYLLHARLLLHRRNLNPECPVEVRFSALENCTTISLETATLLQRANKANLGDGATSFLTTHIFRCTLFLILTGYLEPATTCIRAIASVNPRRDVKRACGRFLSFFVSAIGTKRGEIGTCLSSWPIPPPSFGPARTGIDPSTVLRMLSKDEDMLAYVSADLQACPAAAWLWTCTEREATQLFNAAPPPPRAAGFKSGLFSSELRSGITEEEDEEWGGWAKLEEAVRGLENVGITTQAPPPAAWTLPPPAQNGQPGQAVEAPRPGDASQYGTDTSMSRDGSKNTSPTSRPAAGPTGGIGSAKDRLSIANII